MFEVTVLGNSSAGPAYNRHPSAQILNHNYRLFLLDCGEGAQSQMLRYKIKMSRVDAIFITHLHGDHFFGLPGLLATYNLIGRTTPLFVFSPAGLKKIIEPQLSTTEIKLLYELNFVEITIDKRMQMIYENNFLTVSAFPLNHRVSCYGYLFREKPKKQKIIKEKAEALEIAKEDYKLLKDGVAVKNKSGKTILPEMVCIPPESPRSFAYCTDTALSENVLQHIQNVNLLYHEATFLHEERERAEETLHTTALQAGEIAKKANAGKLLIGHFSGRYSDLQPFLDEAGSVFPETELAIEGKSFSVESKESSS